MKKEPAQIDTYICDEGHLHIEIKDEDGNLVTGISMDMEAAVDLIEDMSEQIDEYLGIDDDDVSGSVH